MTKPIILVDGSSYLFRAFHAIRPLSNADGEPTHAIFGVINMLRKLLRDYEPDQVGVVFDASGKNFRHEMYEDYKANRPPMPDELRSQIEPIHQIIKAMGLPLISVSGVEADDVIGTFAAQATVAQVPVVISTGDKDLAQLVNEHVTLINTMKKPGEQLMDPDGVVEKFGIPPERIIEYLALIGDTSDNVPGVPKVGPKTAVKWLHEWGDLDTIIANAESIKGKVGEYLRDNMAQLELSRRLVTIDCEVPLEVGLDDLKPGEPDADTLRELFTRFEFNSWLEQLNKSGGTDVGVSPPADDTPSGPEALEYETVLEPEQLDDWLEKLTNAELFAFDTETTSLNPQEAELVGLSFAVEPGKAAYVPLAHVAMDTPEQLPMDEVLAKLKPLLEAEPAKAIGHNLKYDAHVLSRYDINLRTAHDSLLQSYVLDAQNQHGMDALADQLLGVTTTKYEEVAGKGKKQLRFDEVSLDVASDYAAEDADITLRLFQYQQEKLAKLPGLASLYADLELPIADILRRIESTGVLIDPDALYQQSAELATRIASVEQEAHKEAGEVFKLGSPKQLGQILFEKLGLPVLRKTPSKQPSTAEDVLVELAQDYALPRLVMEYRQLSKLKSTYTDALPEQIDAQSGRVHTSYQQAVAQTGRLSSTDPNLQNIPVKTAEGRRVRQAFIAPEGYKILAADYSQIELRIMAHLSGDEGMLNAFNNGEDIHRATAAELAGVSLDEVTADQRRAAKAVNFGLIYGQQAFGLAKQLGIGQKEAKAYIETYFERYPNVHAYMEDTKANARKLGFVETLFGRRLYLPDINTRNFSRRGHAERVAINAPMQGSAADIIKRAMLTVDAWEREHEGVRMIMQVHDELVFEVREDLVDEISAKLVTDMTSAAELDVPLEVECGVGNNWDEAH